MIPEIKRGRFLIVLTDGSFVWVPDKPTTRIVEKMIGADVLDTVTLRRGGEVPGKDAIVMFVDDLGVSKDLPVNQKATEYYLSRCKPGTTHEIRGDVALVNDEDFA